MTILAHSDSSCQRSASNAITTVQLHCVVSADDTGFSGGRAVFTLHTPQVESQVEPQHDSHIGANTGNCSCDVPTAKKNSRRRLIGVYHSMNFRLRAFGAPLPHKLPCYDYGYF